MLFEYGDKILEVIKNAEERNSDTIKFLAEKFAQNIEDDKIIHTFGTGHSHMLGIEMFARAGGLGNFDAMLDPDTLTSKLLLKIKEIKLKLVKLFLLFLN